jgi:hypothetical protein
MKLLERMKHDAMDEGNDKRTELLYGAECALAWVLKQTVKVSSL